MQTLGKIISRYMYRITCILVVVILAIILYIQITGEQRRAYETAERTFLQIEQILEANQKELEETQEEYRETCLHNAEVIARIIESDPAVVDSAEELRKVAVSLEIDEIHIFDKTGRIVAGTHPEYYDFTFDSGEQMMFFKPMLTDKTLKLVQEITPNTAEAKLMQYAALWNSSGEFIVQVGMNPVNVMKVTEKNELSYIFSLFRVNPEASYYAVNAKSGEIVGSTDLDSVGRNLKEAGLELRELENYTKGFYAELNGCESYCVFKKIGSNYIGRVIASRVLYQRIPISSFIFLLCLIFIAFFLVKAVIRNMDRFVVDNIQDINKKLKAITDGNLDERVSIESSAEFSELSRYINEMVENLLDYNRKMSYVLSRTNLYIGVYEYNSHMDKVRFTEYMPRILALDAEEMEKLASDAKRFREFIRKIRENPVPDEPGVFKIHEEPEQYVRLEEMKSEKEEIFGVALDVTNDIMKRREIEAERDTDALTGLYNRHGLDTRLSQLFASPEELGYSAMVMIDADGLKGINDTYGHEMGDIYLKKISSIINNFDQENSVVSRQGGDEFVLFLYGYESEKELRKAIGMLKDRQEHSWAFLDESLKVPLRFSLGYCQADGERDYQQLLKEADERMYENKLERRRNTA